MSKTSNIPVSSSRTNQLNILEIFGDIHLFISDQRDARSPRFGLGEFEFVITPVIAFVAIRHLVLIVLVVVERASATSLPTSVPSAQEYLDLKVKSQVFDVPSKAFPTELSTVQSIFDERS